MIVIVDGEGEPLQEFSALYVNPEKQLIVDVFHSYVKYPFARDEDIFARRHVHGLNREFLSHHGLSNEDALLTLFRTWLVTHPYDIMYAHNPAKEMRFLSLSIQDVQLKPWRKRSHHPSHETALRMKMDFTPVCNVSCHAHDKVRWCVKRNPNATDYAKLQFFHHCSLYDCVECFLFLFKTQ